MRGIPRFQPDVGWLNISMNEAMLVSRRQPQGNLPADAQHLGDGQFALALQPGVQRLSLEQGHGQEGNVVAARDGDFTDLKNGYDVVVLDGGSRLGLAEETLFTKIVNVRRAASP